MAETPVARTIADLRAHVAEWRSAGQRVALVPTMGALHNGHLSLMETARQDADRVITSIFVNPRQFAPGEDLDAYPRQEAADLAALSAAGVDLAYIPARSEMYRPGAATTITLTGPAEGLETDHRPHFFQGVATVVAKLLIQAAADIAIFGEKDYQQLAVIRQLAADLDIPTKIIGGKTIRDAHGLALSSRNAYLTADQIAVARQLNVILTDAAAKLVRGQDALPAARSAILDAGFRDLDYLEARAADLSPYAPGVPGRLLVAAWLGQTRLIDNIAIPAQAI